MDKDKSKKFQTLVSHAENLLNHVSWSKEFEKIPFIEPDFTALDVVCFSTNGCPIGINIPNYSEIKENDGFKNISLSNAYPGYTHENLIFSTEKDIELLINIGKEAYVMHVACHELLGHGTGKLLRKSESGEFNFDPLKVINPITNELVDKFYVNKEKFETKFTDISRAYEECRADLCGLYFCFYKEIHQIFDISESNYRDTIYAIWLLYIRKGIIGLPLYDEDVKKWGQAHTQGAWIFVNFLLANQHENNQILTINYDEEKKDLSIELNKYLNYNFRDMILIYGQELVNRILVPLHIWRCTGDVQSARPFIEKYSSVNEYFLKIRKVIIEHQIPRRLELFNNLVLDINSMNVSLQKYPDTLEGIINSFVDR